jgi:hypothetical protein
MPTALHRTLRKMFEGVTRLTAQPSGCAMTELKSALNRELMIGKTAYRLTITPQGFKLVLKGKRKGLEIAWNDLINGDAAMAVAPRASLNAPTPKTRSNTPQKNKKRPKQKSLH